MLDNIPLSDILVVVPLVLLIASVVCEVAVLAIAAQEILTGQAGDSTSHDMKILPHSCVNHQTPFSLYLFTFLKEDMVSCRVLVDTSQALPENHPRLH